MRNPHPRRSHRLASQPEKGCPHCHKAVDRTTQSFAWHPGTEPDESEMAPAVWFWFACGWRGYLVSAADPALTPYGLEELK